VKGALKQMMVVLTPDSVETYTWQPTESPGRFLKCVFLVVCGLIFDLNAFFLKYVLHVPPSHKFNLYRLFLWFAMSNIAIREYYVFIESPDLSAAKLGSNAWLALAVLIVEILVVVKNGKGRFTAPWPRHIVVAWTVAFTVVSAYLIAWHRRIASTSSRRAEASSRAPAKKTSSRRAPRRSTKKVARD
jgi:phosphatidylserine synthase 2